MTSQSQPGLPPVQSHQDLWLKAYDTLDESTKKNLAYDTNNKSVIARTALRVAQDKRQLCIQKQWKYTKANGRVIILRDVVEKVIAWLDKFMKIGDLAMQYDALHAALPWAAVRFVLQVSPIMFHNILNRE